MANNSSGFFTDILRATTASLSSARSTFIESYYSGDVSSQTKTPSYLEKTPLSLEQKLVNNPTKLMEIRQNYLHIKR